MIKLREFLIFVDNKTVRVIRNERTFEKSSESHCILFQEIVKLLFLKKITNLK